MIMSDSTVAIIVLAICTVLVYLAGWASAALVYLP